MECNLTFTESEFYHAIVYLTFEKVTFGFGGRSMDFKQIWYTISTKKDVEADRF